MLFNNSNEYNVGDILMAYDSCEIEVFDPKKKSKPIKMKLFNSNAIKAISKH